jgi:hypothetical protein
VLTFRLDSLIDKYFKPSFIKVDIETAEVLMLNGSERILSEVRPKFIIEVSQENFEVVKNIFEKNKYDLFDAESKNFDALTCFSQNLIAIPK